MQMCICQRTTPAYCRGQALFGTYIIYKRERDPFNGPFSGTTQVSRYQKGKTNLDFTEARDSEW